MESFDTGFDVLARAGAQAGVDKIERRRALSDEELQTKITETSQGIATLQSRLATLNPNSPEYQETLQGLTNQIAARNDLFHPEKNPTALAKFGHMLVSHLPGVSKGTPLPQVTPPTITRTPAVQLGNIAVPAGDARTTLGPQTPAQLKARAEANLVAAGAPPNPADAYRSHLSAGNDATLALQQQQRQATIDLIQKYVPQDQQQEALEDFIRRQAGIQQSFKPISGQAGQPVEQPDGTYARPVEGAEGIVMEPMPAGWQPPAPKVPNSAYGQEIAAFAKTLGKTPDRLTWGEQQQFMGQQYDAKNPLASKRLALAQHSAHIADLNAALRSQEANFRDFFAIQKQLTPLDKIETTAQRAQDYVQNPTGPGDAALLFAFIDSTRPGGFRFNQPEQQLVIGLRPIADGAMARINSGFQGTVLSPDQRAQMARIIQAASNQAETQRDKILSGAAAINPEAGAVAAGNTATPGELKRRLKPPASGGSDSLPTAARSQLRPGQVTTFGNGQEWTLGADGQPERVK